MQTIKSTIQNAHPQKQPGLLSQKQVQTQTAKLRIGNLAAGKDANQTGAIMHQGTIEVAISQRLIYATEQVQHYRIS